MRIKTKILIPMTVITIFVAIAILISNIFLFSNYVERSMVDSVNAASASVENNLDGLEEQASMAALYLSENPEIIDAVAAKDRAGILSLATQLQAEIGADFCTVTDGTGTVIARTHEPENFGDSVTSQANVRSAIAGQRMTTLESGTGVLMSVRSGVPVVDGRGAIVGVISVGFRLDSNEFVDAMKAMTTCETTVFLGDERIATTIQNPDGTRAIGTKAAPAVAEKVLSGTPYTGDLEIMGHAALASYVPITGEDGEVLGMLFSGQYKDESTATIWNFIQIGLGVAAALLILSVVIILMVVRRITTPILNLVRAASDLANGNFNINLRNSGTSATKDEVVLLERSFASVVDIVNKLISDLRTVGDKISVAGALDARIDESDFNGAYKDVAENVNQMLGGVIGDVEMLLDCLGEFGEGNFNADMPQLPGKKAIINDAVNHLRENLISVHSDIGSLVQNAGAGNLSARVALEKYKGDWAGLMDEMNKLLALIAKPFAEASDVMQMLSEGNLDRQMTGEYRGDFLVIKESINKTVTNVAAYIEEIAAVLEALANNNFDQQISREYVGSFSKIKEALNHIIKTLNTVIGDIQSSAEQVSSGAHQISESSMTLANGASGQASSVEELNATIITINENSLHNAESAKKAETLSDNSKITAEKGNKNMQLMLEAMDGIKVSSGKITQVIKVIEDIAFQTNLLALNAAVEAARAGEHGKGFAVVAEEVRGLAGRSQTSVKETAKWIEESVSRVDKGSQIAEETANALAAIVADVSTVTEIIADIARASDSQAEAIGQVSDGLSQITNIVQDTSATSEEMAAASQELSSQSDLMKGLVEMFRLKK